MNPELKIVIVLILTLQLTTGCSDIGDLSSTEQSDTTEAAAFTEASHDGATLISAFYGVDDAIPFFGSYRLCNEFRHKDGMPVIFSKEIDLSTLQAGDFLVTLADGQELRPGCATPAPAEDSGELRTILLIGDFGSIKNQPITVKITGNIISLDQQSNFKDSSVDVTQLESGPTLVHAEVVDESQWELGKAATTLPFGGGSGCPASTAQVIRVVWAGGVTKPGGGEVDDTERQSYRVIVQSEAGETAMTPFAIGDLGDGDNNHELCLDDERQVVRVEFPEGLMTDPREDLNPATAIEVAY